MKKTTTVDLSKSTVHKFWSIVALAGLFVCGLMIGIGMHQKAPRKMIFSSEQCAALSDKISNAIRNSSFDALNDMQKIYAKNCAGYVPVKKQSVKTVQENKSEELSPCARVEKIMLSNIIANADEVYEFVENANIYNKLITNGCSENSVKWEQLYNDTVLIGKSLNESEFIMMMNDNPVKTESTCQEIERLLNNKIDTHAGNSVNARLHNADVYSSLAARGCSENADMYKSLALRELEIVSALSDDELSQNDTEIVIDTYKKLNMQNQAREFLNKMQKLTNPAIDFILSMEKIINE